MSASITTDPARRGVVPQASRAEACWRTTARRPLDVSHLDGPLAALAVVRQARRQSTGRVLDVVGLDATGLAAVHSWAATAGHVCLTEQQGAGGAQDRHRLRIELADAAPSAPAWWQREREQDR